MNAPSVLSAADSVASASATKYAPPGLVAFLIVCALGVALYFLLKSMGKQLGKAQAHFDAEEAALATGAAAPADGVAVMEAVPAPKNEDDAE